MKPKSVKTEAPTAVASSDLVRRLRDLEQYVDACDEAADWIDNADREMQDMLTFIREQVELWDNDGDSGFPSYEHGKKILARHKSQNAELSDGPPNT